MNRGINRELWPTVADFVRLHSRVEDWIVMNGHAALTVADLRVISVALAQAADRGINRELWRLGWGQRAGRKLVAAVRAARKAWADT